jgi:PHD/YefM family antitoxin component YafN of YafNO toxin-antitoxin module
MSSALQYLTNEEGEKTAVIVPWEDYIKFMEDMEDLAAVAERREEPRVNHEQFLAELREDGILHDHLA